MSKSIKEVEPAPTVGVVHEASLRELVSAGAVTQFQARPIAEGYELRIRLGEAQAVLGTSRGAPRSFALLDTLAKYVERVGGKTFEVVVGGSSPAIGIKKPAGPVKKRQTRKS